MSDFEKYIEAKYPNRSPKILFQKFKDIDGTLFYGIKEVEDQAEAWNHQQAKIDDLQKTIVSLEAGLRKNSSNKQKLLSKNIGLQKRVGEYEDLTTSIRNEFNLWTDGREFADVIEAQIENLEALRGEHENN